MPSRITQDQQVIYGFAGKHVNPRFESHMQTINDQNQIALDALKVDVQEQKRVSLIALIERDLQCSKPVAKSINREAALPVQKPSVVKMKPLLPSSLRSRHRLEFCI